MILTSYYNIRICLEGVGIENSRNIQDVLEFCTMNNICFCLECVEGIFMILKVANIQILH